MAKGNKIVENQPLVFTGVTPAQYTRLIEKAKASGIELSGNNGTASKFGTKVAWDYSPDTEQLTLQCLNTPFFLRAGEVDAKLQSLVRQSLAGA